MSRIGKQIIAIPEKTDVSVSGKVVTVKGPLGTLSRPLRDDIEVKVENNTVSFIPKTNTPFSRALWGTYASHVINMIKGVNAPYTKKLIVEGVGYKWEVAGKNINLALGFSHPVIVPIPEGLTVVTDKGTMTISGIDKEMVGQFSANIRALKKPEPYKGKGIRYDDEVIRRKQGKKAA
jgi:large subunit ribosomal protein L6